MLAEIALYFFLLTYSYFTPFSNLSFAISLLILTKLEHLYNLFYLIFSLLSYSASNTFYSSSFLCNSYFFLYDSSYYFIISRFFNFCFLFLMPLTVKSRSQGLSGSSSKSRSFDIISIIFDSSY